MKNVIFKTLKQDSDFILRGFMTSMFFLYAII